MSRKEKSLKNFFGKREAAPISFEKLKKEAHNLSPESLIDISAESSLNHRLKSLKDLYDIVLHKKLERFAVEAICKKVEDMLESQHSIETRHTTFQFLNALIIGQGEYMDIMRCYLFRLLIHHKDPEDTVPRLEMLKSLTDYGKNISYFEEEMGPFLLCWCPDIMSTDKAAEFLALVTNVIKFNAAYLEDETISKYIEYIWCLVCRTKDDEEIEESLNVLDAILCYSHLPDYALERFIFILCLTVNMEKFSQSSWKQMRNLLGTNVGHTCIYSLCMMLEDRNNYSIPTILKGAVFFIGMALWGSSKVPTLIHPPTAVLPSFLKAVKSNEAFIAYEVTLSLQRLIKCGDVLISLCWDIIFNIIESILDLWTKEFTERPESIFAKALHDVISAAEESAPKISYDRLFTIVERCSPLRNEQSVRKLIAYRVEMMNPFKPEFQNHLHKLLERYFRNERRPAIQLETIKAVADIRQNKGHIFEDDLIDQIILQYMTQLDSVPDVCVRKAAVELLIEIGLTCMGSWFIDVLDVIEKVMKHMFVTLSDSKLDYILATVPDAFAYVHAAVKGLIRIFKKKLFIMPSNHCLAIYSLLNNHLNQHYSSGTSYIPELISIRKLILEFLLEMRANKRKQVGLDVNGSLEYSVYMSCDSGIMKEGNGSVPTSPPPSSPPAYSAPNVYCLSYGEAFSNIVLCLKQEKDWSILDMIFQKLPKLLTNKALIVCGGCSVSALCFTLCYLVSDRNRELPDSLKNTPPRLTRTDIQGCIYPCVSALSCYHMHLESHMQRMLIRCLQSGLVSRSAKICIEGLMLCSLEMQNSMVKLLPDVLLKLSKISATVGVSVPVLEFLSNLIRLPQLYVSFVEDQYMSIFAIALPYTNPFKFSQYTVALAHHVIAMWFLKCRIPFRKDFAKFISKGLSSNIRLPREESDSSVFHTEDSSQRESEEKSNKMSTSAIIALHTELMETGLDLMARFTFGMSSNVPKRSPIAEFLLENGQKTSWLVGNKIITITTSGCNTKSFKNGLCERCYNLCLEFKKNSDSYEKELQLAEGEIRGENPAPGYRFERKRHKSAIQRRNTTMSRAMLSDSSQTKDDILVHFRRLKSVDSATSHEEVQEDGFSFLKEDKGKSDQQSHLCTCWCTNWAEVHIRRPTGNTSWLMKVQNQLCLPTAPPDVPLSLLTSMVLQGPWGQGADSSLLFPMHEDILESEACDESPCEGAVDIVPYPKTDPPVRRTNSSPDVNTLWMDSASTDSENAKKSSFFYESSESDKDSFTLSGEIEPEQFERKLTLTEKRPSMRLDLNSEETKKGPLNPELMPRTADSSQKKVSSFRDRGHTISVMSPIHPKVSESASQKVEANRKSGMNPSFVFLQLYHNSTFGPATNKPLLLQQTEANNRALSVFDHIPPYDTHKIGIVYVGPDQANNEVAILSNVYGSARYVSFLKNLGTMVRLTDVNPHNTYLGGLDTREDGKFALIWHDDVMQVVFHVATFMVNKEKDPMRTEKKKHIANDCVVIVYNESGEEYNFSTIKGHVTNACVIITPEDFKSNIVSVKVKTKELSDMFDHSESYMVSDESLPVFVRQLALHANLASLIISRSQQSMKYSHVSNWLERLRTIKRLRSKVTEELRNSSSETFEGSTESNDYDNFTDYV